MCRKIVATKEQLFNFLYEQVWAKNLEKEKKLNVSPSEKAKLIEGTMKSIERAKNFNSAEEIVQFFFEALVSTPGKNRFKNLKKNNLISFEDVKEEFNKLCYGEGN